MNQPINQLMKPYPSFSLSLSSSSILNLINDTGTKHSLEYDAMVESVKKLDLSIKDLISRINHLHRKRAKMANTISHIVKNSKVNLKKGTQEPTNIKQQNERMSRLNVCSRLLGNKSSLSSIIHNTPLPDLPAPNSNDSNSQYDNEIDKTGAHVVNKLSQFLRVSQPDIVANYLNDTGLSYLLVLCNMDKFNYKPLNVDIKGFCQIAPSVLSSVAPTNRQIILKSFFKAMTACANLTAVFEESFQDNDILKLTNLIETHAAAIINARRARLFLGSDQAEELIHMNGNVRVVVPLNDKGLIANCVKKMQYEVIQDPKNSPILDVAVETSLFEGSRNAIICPLIHPKHKRPFVFLAVDKLREPTFSGVDYVLLSYFFKFLAVAIEKVHRAITTVTEEDQMQLIKGLASIASENNSHDMIQKIADVSGSLTSATSCRIFSIIEDNLFEETPGLKIQNRTIPVDVGLIGKSVISDETQNYVLPRRESEFSVQVDDITEPRVWAMLSSPARYNGEITMNLTLYNRTFNTFFSAKETNLITTLSRCICPFLYQTCEHAKLKESLASDSTNSNRSYNLTVFSLKAIETAGTLKIFREMHRFCETLKPKVTHRVLVYDVDKLMELPDMKIVTSEPQLLDAICNMKPIAATSGDRAVLVFPIKIEGISKVFLLEFAAELLHLKTAEEENGLMQRTRLLQSMDEAGLSTHITLLQEQFKENKQCNRNMSSSNLMGLPQSQSRVGFGSTANRSSRVFTNMDAQAAQPKVNLPFIPLSLKSVHEDNMSATSLFELGDEHQKSSDKLLVVQSARNSKNSLSKNPPSFENQLDEDSLQIFPFDPFLTSILQSFSNHSTRQILLHMKITSMSKYKITARSLHILGNSLACPMMFSKLLKIMMLAFTNLFGKDVMIRIFDPPLNDVIETDPTTFNLERDRMIFASIKIPTALNLDKSTALASFADLLTNLIESRAPSITSDPVLPKRDMHDEEQGLEFESSHLTTNEMVCVSFNLFKLFHVVECLNCDEMLLMKWLGTLAAKSEESGTFMMMTDALHFVYFILKESGWMNLFNPSELCALAISVFLGQCSPQVHPNFTYEKILAASITRKTPQKAITRVATNLVFLGDDSMDLLENTPKNILLGLAELMIEQSSKSPLASLSAFHVIKKKIDFNNNFHKIIVKRFLLDISLHSMYFAPISSFGVWVVTFGKEPAPNVLLRARTVMNKYADELSSINDKFAELPQRIAEKVDWMKNQDIRMFCGQRQEEEDEGNMSLLDAR
ncbi:hypothetical protein TRFO_40004 [Tritrichomonas foetus]|uniref:GAF domain-containing protein n=1 Tax=Tritrichomonas foetus TaxID=1144522 RepID=A0A1J4J7T1_9EUKA|nr:hypothetical protein TRFO_40004 [Tritrichomonas foetus]|eukprot:OHS93715.1 hypothetical protein TRFO_40004 [Tritrichomonas foetus]